MHTASRVTAHALAQLVTDGYQLVPRLVSDAVTELFRAEAERLAGEHPASAHGLRDLLGKSPLLRDWVKSGGASTCLPPGYGAVRAILFDKVPGANWKVAWHQDLTIAVQRAAEVPGYGHWSVKDGVPHVQPPISLLERMITLRLHSYL